MIYQDLMRSVVNQVMEHPAFAGIFVEATYRVVTPGTYDPLTSTLSASTVTQTLLRIQEYAYRADELVPDVILPTDRKLLVQQAEYPTKPSNQHEILAGDTLYSIVGVTEEAPGITWTVQGRRKGRTP